MKLTAIFEPAKEGGYTCFVEKVPAAISQGETLEEAKAKLLDALPLVRQCQRAPPREIKAGTVRGICKPLEIPQPYASRAESRHS
jgi:predicted RNase H-like HicB family nuclease